MKPNILEFERLVREYISGDAAWEEVHKYAVEMEWQNATDFPRHLQKPLEELHLVFLADEQDDPQFLLSRSEVSKLLEALDRAVEGGPSA